MDERYPVVNFLNENGSRYRQIYLTDVAPENMNEIEKDFFNTNKEHSFFENGRSEQADLECKVVMEKCSELENVMLDESIPIQDIVNLYEEIYNELLKLSPMTVLTESHKRFIGTRVCNFGRVWVINKKFHNFLKMTRSEFEDEI